VKQRCSSETWSAAMMLDHLGEVAAGAAVLKAIEATLVDKSLVQAGCGWHSEYGNRGHSHRVCA